METWVYVVGFVFIVLVWLAVWNLLDNLRIKLFGEKNFGNYFALGLGTMGIIILLTLTDNI